MQRGEVDRLGRNKVVVCIAPQVGDVVGEKRIGEELLGEEDELGAPACEGMGKGCAYA